MNMKKLLLFFIISVTFLPCVLTPNSKIIADLELALEDASYRFKPNEMLIAADELLRYKPKSAEANFEKARALAKLGKDAEALVLYKLAIRHGYKHLGSLYNDMGESLEKLGRLEEALESYNLAIWHGLDDKWVCYAKAGVLWKLGRFEEVHKLVTPIQFIYYIYHIALKHLY
jgi:tetratricopeptide (TPR) repeat protein